MRLSATAVVVGYIVSALVALLLLVGFADKNISAFVAFGFVCWVGGVYWKMLVDLLSRKDT